jgi:hypothetical protein
LQSARKSQIIPNRSGAEPLSEDSGDLDVSVPGAVEKRNVAFLGTQFLKKFQNNQVVDETNGSLLL